MNGKRIDFVADTSAIVLLCRRDPQVEKMVRGNLQTHHAEGGRGFTDGEGRGNQMFSRRSFHALRHSFTSALANQNVSAELRMKLTGHKTAGEHQKYTHHEMDNLRAAVKKIPSLG
jgi:integrase